MTVGEWPFSDPRNVAVFTDKRIVSGASWIFFVTHDSEDGAWQFHCPEGNADEADASIVGLEQIVVIDRSILELADLPLGWCAWRDTKLSDWQRAPE